MRKKRPVGFACVLTRHFAGSIEMNSTTPSRISPPIEALCGELASKESPLFLQVCPAPGAQKRNASRQLIRSLIVVALSYLGGVLISPPASCRAGMHMSAYRNSPIDNAGEETRCRVGRDHGTSVGIDCRSDPWACLLIGELVSMVATSEAATARFPIIAITVTSIPS
jgi:hypothetical protein